jgi:hypothetical protein
MTVREPLTGLQHLPRDLEVLAFEAGGEDYCEREVDELELADHSLADELLDRFSRPVLPQPRNSGPMHIHTGDFGPGRGRRPVASADQEAG